MCAVPEVACTPFVLFSRVHALAMQGGSTYTSGSPPSDTGRCWQGARQGVRAGARRAEPETRVQPGKTGKELQAWVRKYGVAIARHRRPQQARDAEGLSEWRQWVIGRAHGGGRTNCGWKSCAEGAVLAIQTYTHGAREGGKYGFGKRGTWHSGGFNANDSTGATKDRGQGSTEDRRTPGRDAWRTGTLSLVGLLSKASSRDPTWTG